MQQRVQGILLTPVDPEAETIDLVAERGVPLVIVDRTRNDTRFCSVAVDDVLGGRLALEHLVDLGHRRVAYIGGPDSLGQVRDRLAGAREAWAAAGLPAEDLVVLPTASLTVAAGRGAGERLAGMPARTRPTAAFCGNDLVALGLLQQVIGSGRSVPGDLAIVGYDDIEFAAAAAVPLTSVSPAASGARPDGRRAAPRRGGPGPHPPTGPVPARAGRPRVDPALRRQRNPAVRPGRAAYVRWEP